MTCRLAIEYHRQALAVVEQLGDQRETASTLDRLGLATLMRGDLAASIEYYDRAIALFRRARGPSWPCGQSDGPRAGRCSGAFDGAHVGPTGPTGQCPR